VNVNTTDATAGATALCESEELPRGPIARAMFVNCRGAASRIEMCVNRHVTMASPLLSATQRARATPPRNAPASPATLAAWGTQAELSPSLPKHTRSPIAKARRQQIKRQKAKARKPLATPTDAAPRQPVRRDRLARALACAFARGVAAERANAKERRFAARTTKKASKTHRRAMMRAARRRKAARL
jgi:hypothetical protein